MKRKVIILGASGHGKVVADIAKQCGYEEIVFLDDNETVKSCMGYPVIGKISEIKNNEAKNAQDADFFVAIGNSKIREKLQKQLEKEKLNVVNLIHPKAIIASDVEIGKGTVVMAGAVINAGSRIGKGCIINTGATVDHDNEIGDYVHISVGSHLAGTVKVEKSTWIGIGAIVSNNICICSDCMIGAGAVVVNNIYISGTYIGVPAKRSRNMSDKKLGNQTLGG